MRHRAHKQRAAPAACAPYMSLDNVAAPHNCARITRINMIVTSAKMKENHRSQRCVSITRQRALARQIMNARALSLW